MKMKIFITTVLLIALAMPSFAGDPSRKGTSGADYLLIPVGARGIATGQAFISSVSGAEAIFYNPAGLDVTGRTEAMFSQMQYIADINVAYFAVSSQLAGIGTIGLSYKSVDWGDISQTTVDDPDGLSGTTWSPGQSVIGLSYSKVITDRVSMGVNIKLINETMMNATASGAALDFGVQYRFAEGITIGAAAMNIGSNMQYSGSDLQVKTDVPGSQSGSTLGSYEAVTEPFQIPSYFELSLGYNYKLDPNNSLNVGGAFINNNTFEDAYKFGLEYGFMNTFFVRGGYQLLSENNDNALYTYTAGAGVNYSFDGGVGIAFDYAYRAVSEEALGQNHIFTVKLFFE